MVDLGFCFVLVFTKWANAVELLWNLDCVQIETKVQQFKVTIGYRVSLRLPGLQEAFYKTN